MTRSGLSKYCLSKYSQKTAGWLSLFSLVALFCPVGMAQTTNLVSSNLVSSSSQLVQQPVQPQLHQIAQAQAQVTGTVSYLQRIALPPNAVVEVTLQEVSRLDAAAVLLAEQKIPTAGQQVPILFALSYDSRQINPSYTYVVRAKITVDGQLRWTSSTVNRVITQGNPLTVDILVEPVRQSGSTPVSPPVNPPINSSAISARFDCAAQVRSYPAAQNIRLAEAQRLRLQRDSDQFVYECSPAAQTHAIRYRCRSQVNGYTDRESVTLSEAETLLEQLDGNQFVYQCSLARRGR